MEPTEASSSSSWRVLEFYSGIGGMRYSLMRAMGTAAVTVVEAFEINDKANDVYQFNFSCRPFQGNIQNLTSAELDSYGANAWLLSPPCQPYTRQGLQRDSADARASSFIRILELIPSMHQPPAVMFVENVVGFEISDTHSHLMDILAANNYSTQEFILSPIQFGIPYSRPRYFCLAKRKPLLFKAPSFNSQLIRTPIPVSISGGVLPYDAISQENGSNLICRPIKDFLHTCHSIYHLEDTEFKISRESTNNSEKNLRDVQSELTNPHAVEQIRDDCDVNNFLYSKRKNDANDLSGQYAVPVNLIERWGSAMDIVFPDSTRCCCFTKSYYRYVKGTGSLLATVQPRETHEIGCLKDLGLRYFTPREVANLHSFPEDFDFPPHITLKQRYALLGNSLSVAVVAPLLQYLFEEPTPI